MTTSIPILIRQTAGAFRRITGVENKIFKESGALQGPPPKTRFPITKSLAMIIPFLWAGGWVSMKGAAFLEEHDIFVPAEDDDDD